MKLKVKSLASFWPVVIISLVSLVLFLTNYKSGTWLIGWDSTQPEFNLGINLSRNIGAIWQEYRGLGLFDGMAHASNIVHTVYVYLLSLILPLSMVRYAFVFLTHAIGGVGVYYLIQKLIGGKKSNTKRFVSLAGSLFYLLNPATIQMFYTPLETFIIHFAFLPWLYLTFINYLDSGKRKDLLAFFIVNLLAVSQSHVPTVFIVYAVGLCAISFVYLFNHFPSKLKRILAGFLTVFTVNAFWGLPYISSAIANSKIITNSKINILSNPEVVFMNRSFGTLKDTILLRGFSLNYGDWNANWEFVYQLGAWRDQLYKGSVEAIGFTLFGLSILGIVYVLFKRNWKVLPFILLGLFAIVNLASEAPLFSSLYNFLNETVPYYKEIFRFSFTKFSFSLGLSLSILLAFGLMLFSKIMKGKLSILLSIVTIALIAMVSLPSFKGNFIYERLKLSVPNEYFEVIGFFNKEENKGRVALLPQPSFWGWEYTKWGYRGSGFIWQGINNPTLHRSFDPWSDLNETYYWQLNRALSARDKKAFEDVITKYNISYIILDKNIIQPGSSNDSFFFDETQLIVGGIGGIEKVASFGDIAIYSTGLGSGDYINTSSNFGLSEVDLTYASEDPSFKDNVSYLAAKEGTTYPFMNFDKRRQPGVSVSKEKIILMSEPLVFPNQKELVIPVIESKEVYKTDINFEKRLEVTIPIGDAIYSQYFIDNSYKSAKNCSLLKEGVANKTQANGKIKYSASGGGVSCDAVSYPDLSYNSGYLLRIKGENIKGRSLKFYLKNWKTKRMDLEELLPEGKFDEIYYINSKDLDGSGYSLNFETRSFGKIESVNTIEKVEVYPIPINWLKEIRLVPDAALNFVNDIKIENVNKKGTYNYEADVKSNGVLVLSQAYQEGWGASSKGKELKHEKINGWANGWVIEGNEDGEISRVKIVFWPQYLQFVGYALLVIGLVIIAFPLISKKKLTKVRGKR
ncbi:hypothetical protein ACFL0F_00835 [Patescibacteria group bacterium]